MIDIVERARLVASSSQHMGELMREMADVIERLREREHDAKQLAADNFERVKRSEAEIEQLREEIKNQRAEINRICNMALEDKAEIEREQRDEARKAAAEIERLREIYFNRVKEQGEEIERLLVALKECADDLESWINHHYEKTMDYPSEKLRFERDIEPVLVARKLLLGQVPE